MGSSEVGAKNTDREIWRKEKDYYSPSIHVTVKGAIGINVGGTVIVKEVEEWHKMATNGGWNRYVINPPKESGRYLCIVHEQGDLGESYYQWNCSYNSESKQWSDNLEVKTVLYWMPLLSMPFLLSSKVN